LTERDDVITPLVRGAPRLLGPALTVDEYSLRLGTRGMKEIH